jgi:methionine synthase II (cobalamin-independent)
MRGALKDSIKSVVDLQLGYGIDVITDGEQRCDMNAYLSDMPGLEIFENNKKITGKIQPIDNSDESYKIIDFRTMKSYLRSLASNAETKLTVTGPITLGSTYAFGGVESYYNGITDRRIHEDTLEALLPVVERGLTLADHIQIDEPGISGRYVSPFYAADLLADFLPKYRTVIS